MLVLIRMLTVQTNCIISKRMFLGAESHHLYPDGQSLNLHSVLTRWGHVSPTVSGVRIVAPGPCSMSISFLMRHCAPDARHTISSSSIIIMVASTTPMWWGVKTMKSHISLKSLCSDREATGRASVLYMSGGPSAAAWQHKVRPFKQWLASCSSHGRLCKGWLTCAVICVPLRTAASAPVAP